MLDRYGLIRFKTYEEAEDYCNRLPEHAKSKVCPVIFDGFPMFSVNVLRSYTEGRL